MKINFFLTLLIATILFGCQTNKKINGLKVGTWKSIDTINTDVYTYIEKYKKGKEVKTWKTFKNNKIYKKEKHVNDITLITYYNENKKIITKGQTKSIENKKETHWFYYGDWLFYDETGKLIKIKKYENGELKSEIEIN